MITIAVTTLTKSGNILSHRIARGEKYMDLILNLEQEPSQLDFSLLKDNGVVIKHHVTGNITTAVLIKE